MQFKTKEVIRIISVIVFLILLWTIKSFWSEATNERALQSIALFVVLLVLLILFAFLVMLILAGLRKTFDIFFGKEEDL